MGVVASFLVLPPVNLAVLALLGALVAIRYRRAGLGLSLVSLCLLLLLALPAVSKTLIASLEQKLPLAPPPDAPPEAIVILSGDVGRSDPPFPALDVGHLTLERMRAGVALYRRTELPILVTGGRVSTDIDPVGSLMERALARDLGITVRWTETQSRDTWENAALSAAMLNAEGIRSVYLVTHAWHMRRAIYAFRHFGVTVTAAPVRMDRMPETAFHEFIPTATAWMASYYGLHEWIGCAFYALRDQFADPSLADTGRPRRNADLAASAGVAAGNESPLPRAGMRQAARPE
jgi:uncharacterized SAM-binding protein YcdF (DUF218 family)